MEFTHINVKKLLACKYSQRVLTPVWNRSNTQMKYQVQTQNISLMKIMKNKIKFNVKVNRQSQQQSKSQYTTSTTERFKTLLIMMQQYGIKTSWTAQFLYTVIKYFRVAQRGSVLSGSRQWKDWVLWYDAPYEVRKPIPLNKTVALAVRHKPVGTYVIVPSLTYSRRITAFADSSSSPSFAGASVCFPHLNDLIISLQTTESTLLLLARTTRDLKGYFSYTLLDSMREILIPVATRNTDQCISYVIYFKCALSLGVSGRSSNMSFVGPNQINTPN